jgi:hypothetical protein
METPARDAASNVQAALDLTPQVRRLHQEIERDRMLPPRAGRHHDGCGFLFALAVSHLWRARA